MSARRAAIPSEPVTAILFEGGRARRGPDQVLTEFRKRVVLDNLEKLTRVPEIDQVLLVTNYPDLAAQAAAMAVAVVPSPPGPFHFGRALQALIHERTLTHVICMGGASAPLIPAREFSRLAGLLRERKNIVVANNAQSADIIGFTPAGAIDRIDPPRDDNFLGHLLREAGLEGVLLPNSASVNFDLDTPADLMVMALLPRGGPRAAAGLRGLGLDLGRLKRFQHLLATKGAELGLIGRVSPVVVNFLNQHFAVRVRIFSEERGMKALGRLERGEVVSLIGLVIERLGPTEFFACLARVCNGVLFDTRPVMAQLAPGVGESDRFHSDLGQADRIAHPVVRELTRAALEAPIPVVLGGHTLVYGGLWALAETVLEGQREESASEDDD
jgi:CTP:molybdopterin cytidylyltransferase MocA